MMDIAELKKLYAALPQGPWEAVNDDQDTGQIVIRFWAVRQADGKNLLRLPGTNGEAIARFIVAARNGLTSLLAELTEWHDRADAAELALFKSRVLLDQIVVAEGCDSGVILKSWESPTMYDPEIKGQVYKHEHFSELGDALVALHGLITPKEPTRAASPSAL